MKQGSIRFLIHNLVRGEKTPDRSCFCNVPSVFCVTEEDGASGIAQFENTDRYLWMYVRSGSNKPHSTDVINVLTREVEDNPRSANQAELRKQGFCLYDYDTCQLYAANGMDFFKKYLNKVDEKIRVRNEYKSRDEFLANLRKVRKLRFVAKEDLFTWQSDLFSASCDSLGLENPNQLRVELKFPYVSVTREFLEYLRKRGIPGCDNGSLNSLVVVGQTEEGDRLVESTFNLKNLASSIDIQARVNDSGMYDPEEVKQNLLLHLG